MSRMLGSISHRGPDSFDVRTELEASLGGCRLAIIGSSEAPMPRVGSPVILFNGEIYNYREIARTLSLSLDPSDAESHLIQVLVHREDWRGFARLHGMFAVAAVDGRRILLARDRLGIKPLFYSVVGDEVVFGSEIKAVLADGRVPTILDEQAMNETAVFGYISSPDRTPFAGIKQVPPGTVVEISGARVRFHRYWEPEPASYDGAEQSAADSANDVLGCLRSGLDQMMQHDPLDKGFYLSGGVDSSLLVMLADRLEERSPVTFTLADGGDTPDLRAAREVAKAVGADHHEFHVTIDDYLRELPVFVQHYENVVAGGVFDIHGGMAYQLLSRKVSEHVRVAFSGEGADELFGGYYWSYTHPLGFSDRIRGRLKAIGSPDGVSEQVNALFPRPEDESAYRRNLFDFLIRSGLSNYHLWSVDRSCSAFGFEVRPAYLHDDLVSLALSLPIEARVLGRDTKRVLKEAAMPVFESYGVAHLLHRKKAGMPAAVDRISLQVADFASRVVSDADLSSHPFRRFVKSPLDAMMFDLFHYVFVENRGALSAGFDVEEFYRGGDRARMYR